MQFKKLSLIKYFILLIIGINLFVVFYGFKLFSKDEYIIPEKIGFKESFHESYYENIKSFNSLKSFIVIQAKKKGIKKNEFNFLELINEIVKKRFYFNGYSFYGAEDNLFLYLLGKYVWNDFAAIVIPDDILKKKHAACSQQAIVEMGAFKYFGYDVRKVGLNYHFALEVKYKGKWYFFDPTFEPKFKTSERNSASYLKKNKKILYDAYKHCMEPKKVDWRFAPLNFGRVNDFPAKKMKLVHQFFFFYEKYILIISIILSFMYFWLIKKTRNGIRN